MLSETELGELARMLQHHTPMCQLSDMQVRSALELMQHRGWKIAPPPVEAVEVTDKRVLQVVGDGYP